MCIRDRFEGVSHLLTQGKPADILTLEQYFKDKKLIDQIGGLAYLADIIHNTPSASNITAYAEIISRYSKQRRFLTLGQFIVTEMQSSKDEIESVSYTHLARASVISIAEIAASKRFAFKLGINASKDWLLK